MGYREQVDNQTTMRDNERATRQHDQEATMKCSQCENETKHGKRRKDQINRAHVRVNRTDVDMKGNKDDTPSMTYAHLCRPHADAIQYRRAYA